MLGFGRVGLVAGSYHSLLLLFSLGLPFCFSSYIVHLRCTSEGVVPVFNEPLILSLRGVVRECMLPCRVVVGWMDCIVYTDYVYPAFVSLLADISCLLFFCLLRKCFWFAFLSFPILFHHAFFFLLLLSLAYWPFRARLVVCLIRVAILHFSFRLHFFTSWCFVIGNPD